MAGRFAEIATRRGTVLCLLLLTACGSPSGADSEDTTGVATNSVGCESIIDHIDVLPDPYREVAGAIAMPMPANGLQTGRSEDGFRFAKFGMAVRSGAEVTVSIEPASGDAYLGYGGWKLVSRTDLPQSITFGPCVSETSDWVVHVGGLWTTSNGCVQVEVASGQITEQTTLGVRTTC